MRSQSYDLGVVALTIVTVIVSLFFWNVPYLLPIKVFVVFLHELSHGLAAILTGGNVERLVLLEDQGGLAFTRGGNNFLISSAGYLGSALWGTLLMRLAWQRPAVQRYAILGITAIFVGAIVLFIRDFYSLFYVFLFSAALFLIGRYGGARLHMITLWVLGSFSALYAVTDIATDVLARGPLAGTWFAGGNTFGNDAEILASITFIPAFVWGLLWISVALALYGFNVFSLMIRRGR